MVVSKTTAVFHNGKRRILIFAGLLFNTVTTKLGLGSKCYRSAIHQSKHLTPFNAHAIKFLNLSRDKISIAIPTRQYKSIHC